MISACFCVNIWRGRCVRILLLRRPGLLRHTIASFCINRKRKPTIMGRRHEFALIMELRQPRQFISIGRGSIINSQQHCLVLVLDLSRIHKKKPLIYSSVEGHFVCSLSVSSSSINPNLFLLNALFLLPSLFLFCLDASLLTLHHFSSIAHFS